MWTAPRERKLPAPGGSVGHRVTGLHVTRPLKPHHRAHLQGFWFQGCSLAVTFCYQGMVLGESDSIILRLWLVRRKQQEGQLEAFALTQLAKGISAQISELPVFENTSYPYLRVTWTQTYSEFFLPRDCSLLEAEVLTFRDMEKTEYGTINLSLLSSSFSCSLFLPESSCLSGD